MLLKSLAEVEALSSDHDRIFMSFNIENWYHILGPTRTAATTCLPVLKLVAVSLASLHDASLTQHLTKQEILFRIQDDHILSNTAAELQSIISPGGSFIKTSARSCKDIALQIGLPDRYRQLLLEEIATSGIEIEEMRLRSLFMEAGRQVLRFTSAQDFLVACVMSERVAGVSPLVYDYW
jgi:hypothetical protein